MAIISTLRTIGLKGFGRLLAKKSAPIGPLVTELQDYVQDWCYSKTVLMSFETGEQGTAKLYLPQRATIRQIRLQVVKALAGTDAGTITAQDSGNNNLAAAASFPASTVFGTEATITPTNTTIVAQDGFIQLISAKTTAGGKVYVTVEYFPTPLLS
jgi:hypothetical protein